MSIHWFPGHMAKAKRLLLESVKLVDVIVELRDARIPLASANPLLDKIIGKKARIVALAKTDLANSEQTKAWLAYLEKVERVKAIGLNLKRQHEASRLLLPQISALADPLVPRSKQGNVRLRPARTMIVGIPNVGKSTLINSLAGKSTAKTGSLPGVTRSKQWIKLSDSSELLDTPGILWPKLDDVLVARKLAITGAIGQGGFDEYELAAWLLRYLADHFPMLLERYRLASLDLAGEELLQAVGRARGCLVGGGDVDLQRAADIVLTEFRTGKMGQITLESPPGRSSGNV